MGALREVRRGPAARGVGILANGKPGAWDTQGCTMGGSAAVEGGLLSSHPGVPALG